MIHATAGLNDKPRKKLLEAVSKGKIGRDYNKVIEVKRKLKGFPEPEQQLEILEEFEQQEETSREIFDDIVRKKKEIAMGQREPEQMVEIESDSDKRMLESYNDIKNRVFEIYSDHIKHFKNQKIKQEAIRVLWDIHNYTRKQLIDLGEIQKVDIS